MIRILILFLLPALQDQNHAAGTNSRYRALLANRMRIYHHVYMKRHLVDRDGTGASLAQDDDIFSESKKGNVKYLEITDANRMVGPDAYLENERSLVDRETGRKELRPNKETYTNIKVGKTPFDQEEYQFSAVEKEDQPRFLESLEGNVKYAEITSANHLLGPEAYLRNGETLEELLHRLMLNQTRPDTVGGRRNTQEEQDGNAASVGKEQQSSQTKTHVPVFDPLKEGHENEDHFDIANKGNVKYLEITNVNQMLGPDAYHMNGLNLEKYLQGLETKQPHSDTELGPDKIVGRNVPDEDQIASVSREEELALKGNVKYLEISNANQLLGPDAYLKNGGTLEELLHKLNPSQPRPDPVIDYAELVGRNAPNTSGHNKDIPAKKSAPFGRDGTMSKSQDNHLLRQGVAAKHNDAAWYGFVKSLLKPSNQHLKEDDYFLNWQQFPRILSNQTRREFIKQFPKLSLKESIRGIANTDAFIDIFWPFRYDLVRMNQKIALYGISGIVDDANVKTNFFETMYDIYSLPIPVTENRVITSFNDRNLALMLNRSGLLNESAEYIDRGLYKYSPKEKDTVEGNIRAAMSLINETAPELYRSINQLIACIAVYKETQAGYIGASSSSLPGLIYLNAPVHENDWPVPYYAEQIVHEYTHNVLYLQEFILGTYENHKTLSHAKVISSIRRQLRNFDLGFHAAYVSTALVAFTSRAGYYTRAELLAQPLESSVRALVDANKDYGVLTAEGDAMLQTMSDFVTLARLGN